MPEYLAKYSAIDADSNYGFSIKFKAINDEAARKLANEKNHEIIKKLPIGIESATLNLESLTEIREIFTTENKEYRISDGIIMVLSESPSRFTMP